MTHSPRQAIIATTTAAAIVALAGCANPLPGVQFTLKEATTPTGQVNAPYPADLDHPNDILVLGRTTLLESTINITITSATKLAESYPGGWGYVIAYHTQP